MSFLNLFMSAGKAVSAWRRRERAYAELMALDDRSLADIGIRRSEIRAIMAADRKAARSATPEAAPEQTAFGRRKAA